jgi:hypothetical protein
VGLTPRRRFRINARVIAFGGVAAGLLALAAWVIFKAGTYAPDLLASCTGRLNPNPLFPIPGIVIWAVVAFLAGGIAARLRARFGGSR